MTLSMCPILYRSGSLGIHYSFHTKCVCYGGSDDCGRIHSRIFQRLKRRPILAYGNTGLVEASHELKEVSCAHVHFNHPEKCFST
ncbi:hypothetical protein Y032_0098g3122 [Ancylostoma ceylanicum]|uniref:Uncharacterized protein n=1 Tax=Ancylostoma ceylanicum TaxID=53326 RepID=A0A016TJE2_9BILA|nr:hypothetical protein Y032_0098g3122 [Ancylostoma ceylanicum]